MSAAVDLLLLDVGGVLLLPDPEPIAGRLRRFGASIGPFDAARLHYEAVAAFDRSGDLDAYRRAYGKGLGIGASAADAAADDALWRAPWTVRVESSVDALARLPACGVPVAIVSDSDGTVGQQLLTAQICQVGPGAFAAVRAVYDSAVVGARKPNPLLFEVALREMGSVPERALHVGDSRWCDVGGALRAGVPVVHIDPFGLCEDGGHPHAVDLADIPGLALA